MTVAPWRNNECALSLLHQQKAKHILDKIKGSVYTTEETF